MADPHHIEDLDGFDRMTILSYRTGLSLAGVALAWTAMGIWAGRPAAATWWIVWVGIVLCAANLHLYDKRVRWTISSLVWAGLVVRIAWPLLGPQWGPWVGGLSNGLALAALSGVVLKEWFCFRIPGVRWTPLLLALGVFARFFGQTQLAAVALGLGALGVMAVAIAKWRMPLTHDMGDRSHYQI